MRLVLHHGIVAETLGNGFDANLFSVEVGGNWHW
jgi:hypothetical protein